MFGLHVIVVIRLSYRIQLCNQVYEIKGDEELRYFINYK